MTRPVKPCDCGSIKVLSVRISTLQFLELHRQKERQTTKRQEKAARAEQKQEQQEQQEQQQQQGQGQEGDSAGAQAPAEEEVLHFPDSPDSLDRGLAAYTHAPAGRPWLGLQQSNCLLRSMSGTHLGRGCMYP